MYVAYLKCLSFFIVAPTELLFIALFRHLIGLMMIQKNLLLDACTREIAVAK